MMLLVKILERLKGNTAENEVTGKRSNTLNSTGPTFPGCLEAEDALGTLIVSCAKL